MKIAFDGRYAQGDLVGVGKYIQNLVKQISKTEECIIFYSTKPKFKIPGKNIKYKILPFSNRYLFEQIALPIALVREKVDLYHALGNIGVPVVCPVPVILTVHDIIPLEIINYFSYSKYPLLSQTSYLIRLLTSLTKATKIITVSNYVKNELTRRLYVKPSKIKTIYSGRPKLTKEGILPISLKNQKYVLNNGGIDIRKNLDRLIKSFAIINNHDRKIKLVITGENKRIRLQLEKLIEKLGLSKSVIFTGYVNDDVLSAIIKNSSLVCYPTLSEGFGFPVLEGFAANVPVISSNISSIPEVAGDAALLINPKSVINISNSIEKVLWDIKLRKLMVTKGKTQYNKFDWNKTANEYIDLYHNI